MQNVMPVARPCDHRGAVLTEPYWVKTEFTNQADWMAVYQAHRAVNGLGPGCHDRSCICHDWRYIALKDGGSPYKARSLVLTPLSENRGETFAINHEGIWWVHRFYHYHDHGYQQRVADLPPDPVRFKELLYRGYSVPKARYACRLSDEQADRLADEVRAVNGGKLPGDDRDTRSELEIAYRKFMSARGLNWTKKTGKRSYGIVREYSDQHEARQGVRHIDPKDPSCANYTPERRKAAIQ